MDAVKLNREFSGAWGTPEVVCKLLSGKASEMDENRPEYLKSECWGDVLADTPLQHHMPVGDWRAEVVGGPQGLF